MSGNFIRSGGIALWGVVLLLGAATGARAQGPALGSQLTAELTLDKPCGSTYQIGDPIIFSVRLSRSAMVTLKVRFADSSEHLVINNESLPGLILIRVHGVVGEPPGARLAILDAVAGDQRAHAECDYRAESAGEERLRLSLTLDKGCGAEYQVGEPILLFFRLSHDAITSLKIVEPTGAERVLFLNAALRSGVTYVLRGVVTEPLGTKNLVLKAGAGPLRGVAQCDFKAVAATQERIGVHLEVDRGCGADYHVGEPITLFFRVDRDSFATLRQRQMDGTNEILFLSVPLRAGVTYALHGVIGPRTGAWSLILEASMGDVGGTDECDINVIR